MKKIFAYSSFFTLILFTFFSSCSLVQRTEFAKRKYYNFPYVKNEGTTLSGEKSANHSQPMITTEISSNKEEQIPNTKTVTAYASESSVVSYPHKSHYQVPAIIVEKPKNKLPVISEERMIKTGSLKQSPFAASDAMLLLELILAIFIPPLAVYIHNGRIDRWFWITLILCLVGGGFMVGTYTGYFGLFWATAVVIAICYVLGIIRS